MPVHASDILGPNSYVFASLSSSGQQVSTDVNQLSLEMSDDGNAILFSSNDGNLVPGDTNGVRDLFLRDIAAGTTERVTLTSAGQQITNNGPVTGILSYDGRFVAFTSAPSLVPEDLDNSTDPYILDRETGEIRMIVNGNSATSVTDLTNDGRYALINSSSNNLVTGYSLPAGVAQLYQVDLHTGGIELLSLNNANQPADVSVRGGKMSCDGKVIAFSSLDTNLSAGDTGNWFNTYLINKNIPGQGIVNITQSGNHHDKDFDVSCDGNAIVFNSQASNLVSNTAGGNTDRAYIYNTANQMTEMVSVDNNGNQYVLAGWASHVSANGRFVAFTAGSTAGPVFVRDITNKLTQLVTYRSNGEQSSTHTTNDISADGKVIATSTTDQQVIVPDTNFSANDLIVTTKPLDYEAPNVTGATSYEANNNGWYNADVLINWLSNDPLPSGGDPSQPPATLATLEGVNTYTSDKSCDFAGNCATGSILVMIDKSAPGILASLSPTPNEHGWHNQDVTVTFDCSDSVSGIASCALPTVLAGEGQEQSVVGTATDLADNSTSTTVSGINIDMTSGTVSNVAVAPAIYTSLSRDATITANATDVLSGIIYGEVFIDSDPGIGNGIPMVYEDDQLSSSFTIDTYAAFSTHTVYVRALDRAGNWSTTSSASFFWLF